MTLYNLHTTAPSGYRITKFDDNLVPVSSGGQYSSYILIPSGDDPSIYLCGCPAGSRPSCRHRDMLPAFLAHPDRIDSNWFLDFEPGQAPAWRQYVGPFAHDGGENAEAEASANESPEAEPESAPEESAQGYSSFASDNSESANAPGHTDLMVSPESIEAFVKANPLPQSSFRRRI